MNGMFHVEHSIQARGEGAGERLSAFRAEGDLEG